MKYETIIYRSEADQAFIAKIPELPGCMANGKTKTQALAAAERITRQWIATAQSLGRQIPEPRGKLIVA